MLIMRPVLTMQFGWSQNGPRHPFPSMMDETGAEFQEILTGYSFSPGTEHVAVIQNNGFRNRLKLFPL